MIGPSSEFEFGDMQYVLHQIQAKKKLEELRKYMLPILVCLIVLVVVIILITSACKQIYCFYTREINLDKSQNEVIAIGKSKHFTKELIVKKIHVWSYTALIIPKIPDNEYVFEVVACFCKKAELVTKYNKRKDLKLLNVSMDTLESHSFETMENNIYYEIDAFNSLCPICLEEFKADEKVYILQCKHGFHQKCIRIAVFFNDKCPCCKSDSSFKTITLSNNLFNKQQRSYGTVHNAFMLR